VSPSLLERFETFATRPEERLDVMEGALLIAESEYPDLDAGACVAVLESLASRVCNGNARGLAEKARLLGKVLFEEFGLAGNEADYYDPRNSYINDVLDRKLGIPITLSVVYADVARRAGIEAHGIGFPGHFLAAVRDASGLLVVDPFHGGKVLGAPELTALLQQALGNRATLTPKLLAPAGSRSILIRMLHNLKAIYGNRNETENALRTVEMLLALSPQAVDERRDRGLLLFAAGSDSAAFDDIVRYLAEAPKAPDAEKMRDILNELRAKLARWN
jgi:regulator of sirC expression with transglutaminase-like and TPR domain